MIVRQKKLSVLNIPSRRVARLYRSATDIQLALPQMPSQMVSAFLVLLQGGERVQLLIGLFMTKSRRNIFYVSDVGEVAAEQADQEFEAGLEFAESMGFILNDAELSRMSAERQAVYWKSLPICRVHTPGEDPEMTTGKLLVSKMAETTIDASSKYASPAPSAASVPSQPAVSLPPKKAVSLTGSISKSTAPESSLQIKRLLLKEKLGRFLASL